MTLDRVIPNSNPNWVIIGDFLMFKKYQNIPACYIYDNIVYVFLDLRIYKEILKIVSHLRILNCEFYFTTPEASNPSGVYELKEKIIKSYFISFSEKKFFDGFKKINFDLILNLIKWSKKENCFDLIKDIYNEVNIQVNKKTYGYYNNSSSYICTKEIRDEFNGLYRDIYLNYLLY